MPDVYKNVINADDINSQTTYYIKSGKPPNWVYIQLGTVNITQRGFDGDPNFLAITDANGNEYILQVIPPGGYGGGSGGTLIQDKDDRPLGTLVTKSQEGGRRKSRRNRRNKRRSSRRN